MKKTLRVKTNEVLSSIMEISRRKGNCTLQEIASHMGIPMGYLAEKSNMMYGKGLTLLLNNTLVEKTTEPAGKFAKRFIFKPIKPMETCETVLAGLNWNNLETMHKPPKKERKPDTRDSEIYDLKAENRRLEDTVRQLRSQLLEAEEKKGPDNTYRLESENEWLRQIVENFSNR